MLLTLRNITKAFHGVKVLDEVNFELRAGEVHALIGENGAGKSTLVNIVAGIHRAEIGDIYVEGRKVQIRSPRDAKNLGISVISQEPQLLPNMTVAENIFAGAQPRILGIFTNNTRMKREAKALMKLMGSNLHPNTLVRYLNPSDRYLVAIAQAISRRPRIVVMDEPSEKLDELDREKLFGLIRTLKEGGTGVIYITHRLKEIASLCDRITILRDGRHVITRSTSGLTEGETAKLMLGRDLNKLFPPVHDQLGEELLRVEHLSGPPWFEDVSFSLREGEIIGLAGLVGAGRTALAETIFGQSKKQFGTVYYRNRAADVTHPRDAVRRHLGYVHEDRIESGLLQDMSVANNLSISSLNKLARHSFLMKDAEQELAIDKVISLDIKVNHTDQEVKSLSGGNQQKVMLGRWLAAESDIYLLDEPTRGIDVGSKADLYVLISDLAKQGKGVILISTDMQEILGLCTRILVMRHGRIVGDISHKEASEEKLAGLIS